jgi:hypothetical protein
MGWRLAKTLETMRSYFLSLPLRYSSHCLAAGMVRAICPKRARARAGSDWGLAYADTRTWFGTAQERPLPPLLLPCAGEALNSIQRPSMGFARGFRTCCSDLTQRPRADLVLLRSRSGRGLLRCRGEEIGGRHATPGRLNN